MKTLIVLILVILIGAGIYWTVKPGSTVTPAPSISISATTTHEFSLTSSAFEEGQSIPSLYTCDGSNTNPSLVFNNPPAGTKSFVLTMYDPDVPKQVLPQGYFDHWVVYNIPATVDRIEASSTAGIQGNNGSGKAVYTGPCPPTKYEPKEHRYIFTLYALDKELNLPKGATRLQVENMINSTSTGLLGKATLMGRYQKVTATSSPK